MNQHGSDIALEKLNNIVNLGVNFDNKLSFRDHITDKTNKAYGAKQLSYEDRLKKLKFPTLKYRRLRGDMIEVYNKKPSYR